jgi:hypothetical protein
VSKRKRRQSEHVEESSQPLAKKKRVKCNANKVKDAMTYTNDTVLQQWGETTEYGKSFRLLNEEQQSVEVALLNKGSAKSMKNIIKTKLIHVHYEKVVEDKLRQYLSEGRVSQNSMFRSQPKLCNSVRANLKFLSVGEWVEVDGDRSPGYNSEGGIGVITNVHDDFADVKLVRFSSFCACLVLMLIPSCPIVGMS